METENSNRNLSKNKFYCIMQTENSYTSLKLDQK